MPTPRSVHKAAKAADAIHAKIYAEGLEAEAEEIVSAADGADDQPAAPEEKAEKPKKEEQNAAPAEEQETAEAAPEEQEPEPEQEAAPQGDKSFDQLQSDYQAQLGRNEALRRDVQDLRRLLATMQTVEAAPPETNPTTLLTDEEIEEYGPDLIGVVRRAAQEQTAPLVDRIRYLEEINKKLNSQLGNVSTSMAQSARQAVYSRLSEWNPRWEEVNRSTEFKTWLSERDAFSGMPRQAMLNDAFTANDAERVVTFFDAYIKETQSVAPQASGTPTQASRSPQVALEDLAAPGRSRGGPEASTQDGKKIWTQREIQQFYRDVNAGKFRGKDKERNRLERDIIAAANEPGRVVP